MKHCTSVFTEYLQELGRYSGKIDRGTLSENDFVELQQLQERITNGYNIGYYDLARRQILRSAAAYLIDSARESRRLHEEIKRISREIDKERRAAQRRTA